MKWCTRLLLVDVCISFAYFPPIRNEFLGNVIFILAEHTADVDVPLPFSLAVTRLKNQMTLVESDTKQLASKLKMISGLADNISSKVF